MRNYVQPGDRITIQAAPRDLTSGEGCQIGEALFGAASGPATTGEPFVLVTAGVLDLAKAAVVVDLGDVIYFDNTAHKATNDGTGGRLRIGVAVQAAGTDAASVAVRLG